MIKCWQVTFLQTNDLFLHHRLLSILTFMFMLHVYDFHVRRLKGTAVDWLQFENFNICKHVTLLEMFKAYFFPDVSGDQNRYLKPKQDLFLNLTRA